MFSHSIPKLRRSPKLGVVATAAKQIFAVIPTFARPIVTLESSTQRFKVPAIWLRDNCQCEKCRHPVTHQRQFDSVTVTTQKQHATSVKATANDSLFAVTWQDGHESKYPAAWLAKSAPGVVGKQLKVEAGENIKRRVFWDSSAISASPPSVDYASVMETTGDQNGLKKLLQNLDTYGMCLVPGAPAGPKGIAETKKLADRIAFVRETHYGGFWDFTDNLEHGDTAYTNIALPLHTDTTYFSDPVGLQMFHMVSFEGTGGETIIADGFRAASILQQKYSKFYDILATYKVGMVHRDLKNVHIEPSPALSSVLKVDPETKELYRVQFNNCDRDERILVPNASNSAENLTERVNEFYHALSKFIEILNSKDSVYEFSMTPGCPVILDNWRVLHGRRAFSGPRRLSGCYINRDDWRSKLRVLETRRF